MQGNGQRIRDNIPNNKQNLTPRSRRSIQRNMPIANRRNTKNLSFLSFQFGVEGGDDEAAEGGVVMGG